MIDKYAVFGNPIKQSLSPQIHHQFALQHQLDISYEKLLSDESSFAKDVSDFFAHGGKGCNVTAPFKEQAFELCDELTSSAERAQAVNTLYKTTTGKLCGHNTDGNGLLQDLNNNIGIHLQGKNVTVLGAGGATRGILQPLIEQQPASLTIINRTVSKAETLANEFADMMSITILGTDGIPPDQMTPDVLLNATSASLTAELPITDSSLITANTCCYDLAYATEPTPFLNWCKNAGSSSIHDGRGMLVEQAALAFTTWTNLGVSTKALIENFEDLKN